MMWAGERDGYSRNLGGGLGEDVAAPGDGVPVGSTTIGAAGGAGVAGAGALDGVVPRESGPVISGGSVWSSEKKKIKTRPCG